MNKFAQILVGTILSCQNIGTAHMQTYTLGCSGPCVLWGYVPPSGQGPQLWLLQSEADEGSFRHHRSRHCTGCTHTHWTGTSCEVWLWPVSLGTTHKCLSHIMRSNKTKTSYRIRIKTELKQCWLKLLNVRVSLLKLFNNAFYDFLFCSTNKSSDFRSWHWAWKLLWHTNCRGLTRTN